MNKQKTDTIQLLEGGYIRAKEELWVVKILDSNENIRVAACHYRQAITRKPHKR